MHDGPMPAARRVRATPVEAAYVLLVAGVATLGFTTESTSVIVLSACLALPASVVAVPAYYVAYRPAGTGSRSESIE